MTFEFRYTGIRVRDMDEAIRFFRGILGMKVEGRIKAPWNKGEFANLRSKEGGPRLELNWYADDSPAAGPYREGDELDHLGFLVDDFEVAAKKLTDAGYPIQIGPIRSGGWTFGFFRVIDGIWLDVFQIRPQKRRSKAKPRASKRKKSK